MKLKISTFFFIFTLLFSMFISNAQTQNKKAVYNIGALGMDVGTISVNQQINGDKVIIEAISEVEVRIIFKIKMKYIQLCTYVKGVLQESLLEMYKKGKVDSTTRLSKSVNGYKLEKDGKVSYINDVIQYSGSLLWFHEPKVGEAMYFEISGEKTTVKSIVDHQYSITDPHNGNKNEYTFKNDILEEAIIKHTMANVYLTLKEETLEEIYSN